MTPSNTPVPPAAGSLCFVCGRPLTFAEAVAIAGHTREDERHIQFHRGCGPQLAAEALVSVETPRRSRTALPYFQHEQDGLLEEREKEILYCLASGFSNHEIGLHLGISCHTARNLVSRLLVKLDASSRTEAAVWAVCHGIIATQAMVHDTAMPDAGKAIGSRPRDQG